VIILGQSIKSDKIIGENIRKARNAMDMTQESLAAKLQILGYDISRGTLAKIEAGIRHISVEELNAIKGVLSMKYEDFFAEQ
jgi:transcriptional regulator with XRE-family HTH domain